MKKRHIKTKRNKFIKSFKVYVVKNRRTILFVIMFIGFLTMIGLAGAQEDTACKVSGMCSY